MPSVNKQREVAIWKLYNDDLGSNTFRKDAAVIDKLAGNGNGKLSLAEIDEFERRVKTEPGFEDRARQAKGGWVSPGLLKSEVERKAETSDVGGVLGYLKQGPQAIGAGIFWVLSLPVQLFGNK